MPIGGMRPVLHKKHWTFPNNDHRYPEGAVFQVSGDSAELWIQDYNTRVSTRATVLRQLLTTDKKVMVMLDSIDHDNSVYGHVSDKMREESAARMQAYLTP